MRVDILFMEEKYTQILERIYSEISPLIGKGKVADYIPELGKIDPNQFGMSICTNDGNEYIIGNSQKSFSIQSISKVFTLVLAYQKLDSKLWKRVGLEPSGSRFDSLILLENEEGIPRNPFINAGAIVVIDTLIDLYKDPVDEVLKFVRELSGNQDIYINESVRDSELATGNRNFALAYFMKSYGNIKNDVDKVIEIYSTICSIEMTCVDLARSFRLFSSNGQNPWTGKKILTKGQNKRLNAIMMTCGLYNSVGDFAYRVGIPAKSGVGGGIVGVIPNEMSISTWSPCLDKTGNSLAGIEALELFTTYTGQSIY